MIILVFGFSVNEFDISSSKKAYGNFIDEVNRATIVALHPADKVNLKQDKIIISFSGAFANERINLWVIS